MDGIAKLYASEGRSDTVTAGNDRYPLQAYVLSSQKLTGLMLDASRVRHGFAKVSKLAAHHDCHFFFHHHRLEHSSSRAQQLFINQRSTYAAPGNHKMPLKRIELLNFKSYKGSQVSLSSFPFSTQR